MAISHYNRTISAAFADSVKSEMDSGAGAGLIKVYTAPMQADTTVGITTQTLLGTCTCSDPCGVSATGTLTFSAITQDTAADNSGTAAWARFTDSTGTVVKDHDITVVGGGGALQMVSTTIVAGGPIAFTSLTETLP